MTDWVKERGGTERETRSQDRAKENFDRNLPAFARDGKEIAVEFDAGTALTVSHGLRRVPQGWFLHSHKGSPHAVCEVLKNDREIRLINNYGGAGTLTAKLWIW